MQRERMLQITRTDGRHCLRAFVMALLAVLLLAASAQAEAPPAGGEMPESLEAGAGEVQEPQLPAGEGEGGQEAPAGAGGETEAAPETTATEPPPGETQGAVPPSEPVEPVAEAPPPPPSEPVEPVAEAPPPPSEPVEGAPAGTTPAEGAEPTTAAPGGEGAEESAQGKAAGSSEEGAGGGLLPHSPTLLTATSASQDAPAHVGALGGELPSTPSGTPATVTVQVAEVSGQAGASSAESLKPAGTMSGSQAGRFSCELSALGGNATDNCTAGWLGAPRELTSAPTSAAVAAVSSLTSDATVSLPAGTGHDGSTISGPPLTPAPGPAPGGGSGVATGAGASGAGVSLFLTLAGLLLLGAPRVLRRLGLSFEPWLAGCFVLIPERPD
jgi:hypothetical protein